MKNRVLSISLFALLLLAVLSIQSSYAEPEYAIDRPGSDIERIVLPRNATWQTCENECFANPNCQAWTYVYAGYQTPNESPTCWTKFSVPAAAADVCCVSGVKP